MLDQHGTVLKVSYFKLFRYASVFDVVCMCLGTLGGMANGAALPVWAYLFGDLLESIAGDIDMKKVEGIALSFLYLALGAAVVSYLQMGLWILVGTRQARAIRIHYLRSVLSQDISFFDAETGTGSLLTKMNEDAVAVETAMGEKVGTFVFSVSMFLSGIIIAFRFGWDITLVMLAVMPLLGGSVALLFKVMSDSSRKSQAAYSEANSIAQSALSAVRTVYSFNAEAATQAAYERRLGVPERMGVRQSAAVGLCLGAFQLFMFCAYALALWYAAGRIRSGEYDGGTVMTVFFSALIGGFSIGQANPCIVAFQNGRIAGARLFAVIDRAPSIDLHKGGRTIEAVAGEVSLRGVEFAYPSRPEAKVLDGVSLTARAGQTVALVGQSGSGKSTIISLVERYYDPLAGSVCLDGVPLCELDLKWLRSQIGLVSQEPALFATTIYENIAYGRPGATEAEVRRAAQAANADSFILELPSGYETTVGEGGVQLSGGQKQRVAIARAVLKDPKVLLLDEATSALDAQSERLVQGALERLMAGRTTIVIAHRLTTIRGAQHICVMQQGKLVEEGSHEELLAKPRGAYAQLIAVQEASGSRETRMPSAIHGDALVPSFPGQTDASQAERAVEAQAKPPAEKPAAKGSGRETRSWLRCLSAKAKQVPVSADEEMALDADKPREPDAGGQAGPKLGRLMALNAREWHLMVLGVIGSAGLGATMPAFAVALSSIIAVFFSPDLDEQKQKADMWCLIFVAVGVLSFVCSFLEQFSFGVMGARLATRVRVMLFGAMLRQEVGWFDRDENNSGALTSMLGTDAAHIRGAVGDTFGIIAQNLFTLGAGFVIAFLNDWRMTLVIIAAVPLIVVAGIIQAKLLQESPESVTTKEAANADQVAAEAFQNIRIVQAFNLQEGVTSLWEKYSAADARGKSRRAHVTGVGLGFSEMVMYGVYGLAFWYGGTRVEDGQMGIEQMLKVFFAVVMGAMGASNAQMSFPDAHKANKAAKRVFSVVDRVPQLNSNSSAEPPQGGRMNGAIQLENVRFVYPSRPEVTVLKKLDLTVEPGKIAALVGESGSGKSTIVGLLERFYDVAGGSVSIDGVDVRKLPLKWVRDNLALVSQEPTLFAMTVRENIKLGRPNATNEEVEDAATLANAAEFIRSLPEGFETLVGERGTNLSGGQKQRIAIARAVLKDPSVLLLDEATSALDTESEQLVADALEKLMQGRTTIIVAHRLSTIRRAHVIAVMKSGQIIEQGTHEQLLKEQPEGIYSSLISLQQSGGVM
mmetsp:Transcript_10713/g.25404  ORF Transcript_10713/g.25404 Transcript_10713/m.25404 type:complete len:1267 (+) Transcript_10713:289-4089(+)